MTFKDWLPLITILGPILAALLTLAATRYFRERRRLEFLIVRTEDLTLPLRRSNEHISFKIDDVELTNFNRALIFVRNKGNASITAPKFQVKIPGVHNYHLFDITAKDARLQELIKAHWDSKTEAIMLDVTVPFLNPKDTFRIAAFFDGETVACEILFRMEGVSSVFKRNNTITAFAPEALNSMLNAYERIPIIGSPMVYLFRRLTRR